MARLPRCGNAGARSARAGPGRPYDGAVLEIPAGELARERWHALVPDERRKILADATTGRAQGMPELARIAAGWARTAADASRHRVTGYRAALLVAVGTGLAVGGLLPPAARVRSEEHTSELQSHSDLVCRLLLEKKKIRSTIT